MNAALTDSLPARLRASAAAAPPWVAAALVVALGLMTAQLVWMLVPQPAWQPAPAQPAANSDGVDSGVDLNALVSAHLFGKPAPKAVVESTPDPVDAPDTKLNLTLRGIFAAMSGKSIAMIETSRGDEKPYGVDDEISRGTTVHEIYADRVILDRGGRLETLRLNKDDKGPARRRTPSAPTRTASRASSDAQRTVAPTATLRNIRQELLTDPSKASQYLRVQPAYNAGQLKGYRIYPGRNRSLFSEAGLRAGDLVTELNGTRLDDPAQALQMLGTLSQASSLNVTVQRGGQTQSLSLTMN